MDRSSIWGTFFCKDSGTPHPVETHVHQKCTSCDHGFPKAPEQEGELAFILNNWPIKIQ